MGSIDYFQMGKKRMISPTHAMVKNWSFNLGEEEEANLADAMAKVGSKNGISTNDLNHLFPAVLRMLKNESSWTE